MTRKHRLTRTALALATAVAASPALADTVTTSGWYFGGGKSVNTKTTATVIYGGSSHSPIDKAVSAGAFRATWNGRTFETYCTDIFQTIGLTATYSGFSLHDGDAWFSPAKARDLGRLWTVAHDGAGSDAVDAKSSAAFQIAAWEILYESSGSYNLASGVFQASGGSAATGSPSALQLAGTWLGSLPSTSLYSVDVLVSATRQDLLVATPVPEPESYAMFIAGLGLMAVVARRRSMSLA